MKRLFVVSFWRPCTGDVRSAMLNEKSTVAALGGDSISFQTCRVQTHIFVTVASAFTMFIMQCGAVSGCVSSGVDFPWNWLGFTVTRCSLQSIHPALDSPELRMSDGSVARYFRLESLKTSCKCFSHNKKVLRFCEKEFKPFAAVSLATRGS